MITPKDIPTKTKEEKDQRFISDEETSIDCELKRFNWEDNDKCDIDIGWDNDCQLSLLMDLIREYSKNGWIAKMTTDKSRIHTQFISFEVDNNQSDATN